MADSKTLTRKWYPIQMKPEFWIDAWNKGETNFHKDVFHEKLVEYFPRFQPVKGQRVLVPLCGKSKDLLWLAKLGLTVHGVELHEPAVQAFFAENNLPEPFVKRDGQFAHYCLQNFVISCGDFFQLDEVGAYDFVYDRAALVALPEEMRKAYAAVIKLALKPTGKGLLISYEYDQSKKPGPPFSVDAAEVRRLFSDRFSIKLLEETTPAEKSPSLAALEALHQKVYVLG